MASFKLATRKLFHGVILFEGIFGIISNSGELERGTCHSKEVRVEVSMTCDIKNVQVNIVSRQFQHLLLDCKNSSGNIFCHNAYKVNSFYNGSSGLLVFITQFNYTHQAGNRLWVNSTCHNNDSTQENVLLKPCVSGFRTAAYHNQSHVTISCEHESFKMSDSGIRLVTLDDLAHCRWNKFNHSNHCFGEAEALENGLKLTIPYTTEINISCKIDEQSINIEAEEYTSTALTNAATTDTTYDTTTTKQLITSKKTNVSTSTIILTPQKFVQVEAISGGAAGTVLFIIVFIGTIVCFKRHKKHKFACSQSSPDGGNEQPMNVFRNSLDCS